MQKRCVEMEARRQVRVKPDSASQMTSQASLAPIKASQPPAVHGLLDMRARSAAKDAVQQSIDMFEHRCVDPIHARLNGIDDRLARFRACLETIRSTRNDISRSAAVTAAKELIVDSTEGHAAAGGGDAAGPLPVEPRAVGAETAEDPGELGQELRRLRQQLADGASRAALVEECRDKLELRSQNAERRALQLECQQEDLRKQLCLAERRAEDTERRCMELQEQWKCRHMSLQRQLQRTEQALGQRYTEVGGIDDAEALEEEADCPAPVSVNGDVRPALLRLLREARTLEQSITRKAVVSACMRVGRTACAHHFMHVCTCMLGQSGLRAYRCPCACIDGLVLRACCWPVVVDSVPLQILETL